MSFNRQEYPILFIRNLPYEVTRDDLYELFGKYGAIQQIRLGNAQNTKGSAYIVYEEVRDSQTAREKLSGFKFRNRYLVVMGHQLDKLGEDESEIETRKRNLEELKKKHSIE